MYSKLFVLLLAVSASVYAARADFPAPELVLDDCLRGSHHHHDPKPAPKPTPAPPKDSCSGKSIGHYCSVEAKNKFFSCPGVKKQTCAENTVCKPETANSTIHCVFE